MLNTISKPNPKPKPPKREKRQRKPVNKVSGRGQLINKIHAVMRDIVIERDRGCVCVIAPANGHSPILQAGHIILSTKSNVRFDLMNVHCQCKGCNSRHVNFNHYYIDWFIGKFGEEEYHRIVMDSHNSKPLKSYELQELLVQMTKIRQKQLAMSLMGEPFKPYYTQAEILSGAWSK